MEVSPVCPNKKSWIALDVTVTTDVKEDGTNPHGDILRMPVVMNLRVLTHTLPAKEVASSTEEKLLQPLPDTMIPK